MYNFYVLHTHQPIIFCSISYLALVAALACEADFVFIPEWPPEIDWPVVLCKKLLQARIPPHFLLLLFPFDTGTGYYLLVNYTGLNHVS